MSDDTTATPSLGEYLTKRFGQSEDYMHETAQALAKLIHGYDNAPQDSQGLAADSHEWGLRVARAVLGSGLVVPAAALAEANATIATASGIVDAFTELLGPDDSPHYHRVASLLHRALDGGGG